MSESMYLADIYEVDRHRRDLGDIDGLAASIAELGLLQPIVVTPEGRLIAGGRRLAALKQLGETQAPVHFVDSLTDALALLKAERDENTQRKDFTASEIAGMGAALEEAFRPAAQAASAANGFGSTSGSREPLVGRVREQVGEALGVSGATYERIKSIDRARSDDASPEVREAAEQAMEALDEGAPVRSTYETFREAVSGAPDLNYHQQRSGNVQARRLRDVVDKLAVYGAHWADLNLELAFGVLSDEDRSKLASDLGAALTSLRRLHKTIEGTKK